jgi:membrane protein insertase Oxa1/YidC/SpoIIIJ
MPFVSDPANYGAFYYLGPFFNLLPVIAACLMLFVQKMMMPPPSTEQEEMQQKMMKYMPIMMGVIFFKVASGLCIYFIVSSLWGLIERKLLLPKKHPDVTPPADETAEKKDGESSGLLARAYERIQNINKEPAAESAEPAKGGRKNRRQRKKDKQKGRGKTEASGTTTPATNGGPPSGGLLDRVKAWCLDVLKKAEKR